MINKSRERKEQLLDFMLKNKLDIIKLLDLFQGLIQIYIKRYKRENKLSNKDQCLMVYEKLRGNKIEFSIYNGRSAFETVMIPIDDVFSEIILFYKSSDYYILNKQDKYFSNMEDVIKFLNVYKVEHTTNKYYL